MFEQGPWRRQKKFFAADHLCSLTRLTSCSAQCLPRFSHAIYYFSLFWSSSSPTHQFVARLFFQIIYIGRSFAKRSVYVLSLTPCESEYFKIFQQFCLQHVSQEPQVIFDSETNIYRVFSTSSYYHLYKFQHVCAHKFDKVMHCIYNFLHGLDIPTHYEFWIER